MVAELRGKWALVTGASRGIGRQVALALADLGVNLVLHSRKRENTDKLRAELAGKNVRLVAVAGELSDQAQVDAFVAEAQNASGGIDILINNAAIMTPMHRNYVETPAAEFRLSFEVNVTSPIMITYKLLPEMLKRRWGRIVQVTSGIRDQPELMAYAASKAALDKFVYDTVPTLRGTGVLMNLLDPGWLRTDLGGPNAPNAVESVLPGALVPVLVDGEVHGVLFNAQHYRKD